MRDMRLYLVNPDNPVVSLNNIRWNRLNRYRVWKPLRLLVVAGLTPPDWEVTLIDENLGHPDYERLPKPDLVGITALTSQAPQAYEVAPMYRATGVPVVSEAFTPRFVAKRGWTTRMRWSRERRNRCGGRCWPVIHENSGKSPARLREEILKPVPSFLCTEQARGALTLVVARIHGEQASS
jgi:hypothetical protein